MSKLTPQSTFTSIHNSLIAVNVRFKQGPATHFQEKCACVCVAVDSHQLVYTKLHRDGIVNTGLPTVTPHPPEACGESLQATTVTCLGVRL